MNLRERWSLCWKTFKKRKKAIILFCLIEALFTRIQVDKQMTLDKWQLQESLTTFTTLRKSVDVSCTILTEKLIPQLLSVNLLLAKLIRREEIHSSVSTLVLILSTPPQEGSWVPMFGSTVLKRPKTTLTSISLTTSQSPRKKKWKLKTKLTK